MEESELLNYKKLCKKHKTAELKIIIKQIGNAQIELEAYSLSETDFTCFFNACDSYSFQKLEKLNLAENKITDKLVCLLAEFIEQAKFLTFLNLKNCKIQQGMDIVLASLDKIKLDCLNISGNLISATDMIQLVKILENQEKLENLYLSNCYIDIDSIEVLTKHLVDNTFIKLLDLSWNQIAKDGSVEIAQIFNKNQTIEELDLSMNGFGIEACKKFSKSLIVSKTLKYLDLSYNHVHKGALNYLLNGLYGNDSIQTLILTGNPLDVEYPLMIVKMLAKSKSSVLTRIEIKNASVNEEFEKLYHNLEIDRDVAIFYEKKIYGEKSANRMEAGLIGADPLLIIAESMRQKNLRIIDFFQLADEFKNKALTWRNISSVLNKMHIHLSEDSINIIMKAADDNNDGEISFQELQVVIENARKRLNELKRLEKNKDHPSSVLMAKIRNILKNCEY